MSVLMLVLAFILGGFAGAYIVYKSMDNEVDELIASGNRMVEHHHKIVECYKKIVYLDARFVHSIYSDLVRLRDTGTPNLDEVIGVIGEALNDHKEEETE